MDTNVNAKGKVLDFLGLFLLSLATLLYEINLTRLFSVAQYYHFAFLIIGFAMFGFGASGTSLALFPALSVRKPRFWMAGFSFGMGLTCLGGYILFNFVPFDSFSIAWDWHQGIILAFHSLVLSLPFFCSGAVLNICFTRYSAEIGKVYAVNLVGSAFGCALAMIIPRWIGGDGVVWVSALVGFLCCQIYLLQSVVGKKYMKVLSSLLYLLYVVIIIVILKQPTYLELHLSPYKGLSYAKQYPDSEVISEHWNGYSRIDVVTSEAIRSFPGLSYMYNGILPKQRALFVDGDGLNGILSIRGIYPDELAFTSYLPSSFVYDLRPNARVLILEPKGGLEVWSALAQGSKDITVVESNPLITLTSPELYERSEITVVQDDPRSAARTYKDAFDIVSLPLTTPYRPIRSGAYSLAEDYTFTIQAFRDYLTCLKPDGLLVITTWLQTPPSESLRTFTTLVTALESLHLPVLNRIIAYRGYNTMTFIISRHPFTLDTFEKLYAFTENRAYDVVFGLHVDPGKVNKHNILPEPIYYKNFYEFALTDNRKLWYKAYPFDVSPATDVHPFFSHFFKLRQTKQIFAELGKTWQPFGGAGYFVIIILLVLSLGAAGILILLPGVIGRFQPKQRQPQRCSGSSTYMFIGLAFMLVEIPLTQRFILYLGHPAYAMTAVLFTILTASGLGSLIARKYRLKQSLIYLVCVGLVTAVLSEVVFVTTLSFSMPIRLLVTVVLLFPLGILMGMPFSQGMRAHNITAPRCIAYVWSVNGAASVVSSIMAAFLVLTTNFRVVYLAGLVFYAIAAMTAAKVPSVETPPLHHQ